MRLARIAWALAALTMTGTASAGVMVTDAAVFSANSAGENWNGWIWNTQAPPEDAANRWNLYYSSATDPDNPVFLNSGNGAATGISLDLGPGTHSFRIYGETVTPALHPEQHFVLNLYVGGNQAAPDISGLYGSTCLSVCAASHWNGLDLFGNSGLGGNTDAQEAGTLAFTSGAYLLELTHFSWRVDEQIDEVGAYFTGASGDPDFLGRIDLEVTAVPAPGVLGLLVLGFAGLWRRRGGDA